MQVTDRVLVMGSGNTTGSWVRDRTKDRSYGRSALTTPLSFGPDTKIGIEGGNLDLPILDVSEDYYIMPGEVDTSCFKGKQCMGTTSRRYAATFYKKWGFEGPGDVLKLFQGSSQALGAWNLKDMMTRRGIGNIVWEKNSGNTLKELFMGLQGGDMVTFTRRDKTSKSLEDNPNFEEESEVTHMGLIVGQDSDGTPIVEHSYLTKGGKHVTRRERIDQMKDYIPSSILRPGMNKPIAPQQRMVTRRSFGSPQGSNISGEPTIVPTKPYSNTVTVPSSFKSISALDKYLHNELPAETRMDLNRMGVYDTGTQEFNMFEVPDEQAMFLLNDFLAENASEDIMVSKDKKELREESRAKRKEDRIKKREDRKLEKIGVEIQEDEVPLTQSKGLIYKK